MAEVILHTTQQAQVTCVPNRLIDRYMRDANGEYLKVYLYLLRHLQDAGTQVSISGIADALDLTEKDVRRALAYWDRMHLLRLERDEKDHLCGICLTMSDGGPGGDDSAISGMPAVPAEDSRGFSGTSAVPAGDSPGSARPQDAGDDRTDPAGRYGRDSDSRAAETIHGGSAPEGAVLQAQDRFRLPDAPRPAADAKGTWKPAERPAYSAEALAQAAESESVRMLVRVTELYLNRHLTHTDTDYILYWLDGENGLGMSPDLAEYVVEHCANAGHTDIHYINRVALSWHERGIRTVEEAREKAGTFRRIYGVVKRSLGISSRELNDEECAQIDRWMAQYDFSDELIAEACHRTIAAINQPRFSYVSGILEKWSAAGVRRLTDVSALDASHAKEQEKTPRRPRKTAKPAGQFYQFQSGEYDYAALEQALREN